MAASLGRDDVKGQSSATVSENSFYWLYDSRGGANTSCTKFWILIVWHALIAKGLE